MMKDKRTCIAGRTLCRDYRRFPLSDAKEKSRLSQLIELFFVFAFIGGTTFGGGYAMLPILQREIVEKRKWATEEELMDYYAIGQCTPGIIAVNTATFIGYKQFGIMGGILATLGVVAPSVVIITIIAAFLTNFAHLEVVKHAFAGIRAVVCILIFDSVLKLGKKSIKDNYCWIIFLSVLGLSLFTDLSPIWLVLMAGAAGYIFKPMADAKKAKATVAKADTTAKADNTASKTDTAAKSDSSSGKKGD